MAVYVLNYLCCCMYVGVWMLVHMLLYMCKCTCVVVCGVVDMLLYIGSCISVAVYMLLYTIFTDVVVHILLYI